MGCGVTAPGASTPNYNTGTEDDPKSGGKIPPDVWNKLSDEAKQALTQLGLAPETPPEAKPNPDDDKV